jgi:PKD repeat protein
MEKYTYLFTLIALLILNGCDDTKVKPKPKAAFHADKTLIDQGETIYFTDDSENNPTIWVWDFGDGSEYSYAQNPSHTYTEAGTFTVTLGISNDDGDEDYLTKTNYITVNEVLTDVTFNNPVFTDIYVTIGATTKTIAPGGTATFYGLSGSYVSFDAYTSGKTSTGTQVGLRLTWNNYISLTGGTVNHTLNVGSDYFFIYIRNYGTHVLNNLYVNYGLSSQTYDNILIPNDNVNYSIGYYRAYTNSNVRMYYQDSPSNYVYWNQGSNFILPWTDNQYYELWSNLKTSQAIGPADDISVSAGLLIPSLPTIEKKFSDKNTINHYCK